MSDNQTIAKNDFIQISYSGFANGELFDSNIEADLKKLNPKAKPEEMIICVGQQMVVPGLDKQLEGKEVGKEYTIKVPVKDAFGPRKRELIRTIPLKAFTEQKVNPQPGMILTLDQALVKIVAVSGARVITDFNNPLAGKDLEYKITITRKVTEEKEKAETLFKAMLRFVPEFEIKDKIIIKGPKILEQIVTVYNDQFKELVGKELGFEEKPLEDKKEKPAEKTTRVSE